MKISVSSYSYYQAIRDGRLTLEQTIDKAHEMGFEAIEFLGSGDIWFSTDSEKLLLLFLRIFCHPQFAVFQQL